MKITEHDVLTGEIIEREATKEEITQAKIDLEVATSDALEIESKAAAKSALLERLGISENEAKLLLS
jgi:hypothetical protein